jgi:hypothetical protein
VDAVVFSCGPFVGGGGHCGAYCCGSFACGVLVPGGADIFRWIAHCWRGAKVIIVVIIIVIVTPRRWRGLWCPPLQDDITSSPDTTIADLSQSARNPTSQPFFQPR